MKPLRLIRLVAAVLFFGATVTFFVIPEGAAPVIDGLTTLHPLRYTLGSLAGAAAVWTVITLIWGRIYCSTVCPVGTLIDAVVWLRRKVPALRKPFRYKTPGRLRIHVLLIYTCCVAGGLTLVPLVLDPFHIMGNIMFPFTPDRVSPLWTQYGLSAAVGMAIGLLSLTVLVPYALLCGRDFCNVACPLGIAMGYAASIAPFRVAIDPDRCVSCGQCEQECAASAIKVAGRHVDNSRCVRCFRCVARCPEGAIRYTKDRNRPASPLMDAVKTLNRRSAKT